MVMLVRSKFELWVQVVEQIILRMGELIAVLPGVVMVVVVVDQRCQG